MGMELRNYLLKSKLALVNKNNGKPVFVKPMTKEDLVKCKDNVCYELDVFGYILDMWLAWISDKHKTEIEEYFHLKIQLGFLSLTRII